MPLRNLTPHTVNVVLADGTTLDLAPEHPAARATTTSRVVGTVAVAGTHVPVVETSYGPPDNLPDPTDGVHLLVSRITATAAQAAGRPTGDLLVISDEVRDADGHIVGCRRFARV